MPKTWTKTEVIELMLKSVRKVKQECVELNQKYTIEDAMDQVYEDLDERGLIELTP